MPIFDGEQEVRSRTIDHVRHLAAIPAEFGIKQILSRRETPYLCRKGIVEPVASIDLQGWSCLKACLRPGADGIDSLHDSELVLQNIRRKHALTIAGAKPAERLSAIEFAFHAQPR